jgi:hypothetical protein
MARIDRKTAKMGSYTNFLSEIVTGIDHLDDLSGDG